MTEQRKDDIVNDNVDNSEIKKVIMRVIQDEEYKTKLMESPEEALAEYELTSTQRILIKSLNREELDKLTPDTVEEFFSAEAAVYTPDAEADPDDFETFDDDDSL